MTIPGYLPLATPEPPPPRPVEETPREPVDMRVTAWHDNGQPRQIVIPAPNQNPISGSRAALCMIGGAFAGGMGGGYVALMLSGNPAIAAGAFAGGIALGALAGWLTSR